jgi:hypothetical protein
MAERPAGEALLRHYGKTLAGDIGRLSDVDVAAARTASRASQ